jgi:hypothetical protein
LSIAELADTSTAPIRYRVELSETERLELEALLRGGKNAARQLERTQILHAANAGASDETIASAVRSADRRFIEPSGASSKAIWNSR